MRPTPFSFRHAGDFGDVVYSGVVIRYVVTDGKPAILAFEAGGYTRQKLTPDVYKLIAPLMLAQPYIGEVVQFRAGMNVDVNLNDFRKLLSKNWRAQVSLCQWMCRAHGVPEEEMDKAWITVPEPKRVASVIVNRSGRRHNTAFPWAKIREKYREHGCLFVGYESEYDAFRASVWPDIAYHHTDDCLQLAEVIAGADLFIGNQSLPYAIAEGMKKPAILEVWAGHADCLFHRPDCWHGWDHTVTLPDLID